MSLPMVESPPVRSGDMEAAVIEQRPEAAPYYLVTFMSDRFDVTQDYASACL